MAISNKSSTSCPKFFYPDFLPEVTAFHWWMNGLPVHSVNRRISLKIQNRTKHAYMISLVCGPRKECDLQSRTRNQYKQESWELISAWLFNLWLLNGLIAMAIHTHQNTLSFLGKITWGKKEISAQTKLPLLSLHSALHLLTIDIYFIEGEVIYSSVVPKSMCLSLSFSLIHLCCQ